MQHRVYAKPTNMTNKLGGENVIKNLFVTPSAP